jgi:hypoxanthine phosphoribosyltransferase
MPVETSGFDELIGDINRMAERLNTADEGAPAAKAILQAAAVPIDEQMKANASRDPKIITNKLHGAISTGKVKKLIGLNADISGRTVVIVEDIIDTGCTMQQMLDALSQHHPASIHICTLFVKPEKLKVNLDIEYSAFSIPNDFIVGYGLDYDQQGRNLPEVYTLVES